MNMNPIQNPHRGVIVVLLPCLLLFTGGCAGGGSVAGYSHEGVFDESVRTIAVPIFENRSFYREAEFRLTEALTKEIEHRTPYKVTREGGADTMITGTILSVDQRLLSRTRAGLSQEVQVVVTVGFEWKDLRSGEVLRSRSRIESTGEFIPTRGVGEPFEVARHAAVDEMSRQIVSVMRGDW